MLIFANSFDFLYCFMYLMNLLNSSIEPIPLNFLCENCSYILKSLLGTKAFWGVNIDYVNIKQTKTNLYHFKLYDESEAKFISFKT